MSLRKLETCLCYLLWCSGLTTLAQVYNRRQRRVPILTYHSIPPDSSPASEPSCLQLFGMTVPGSSFRRHIEYLSRHYQIVGLQDYINYCNGTSILPSNPLVLTFDDGLMDNFTTALPVLKEHGCKATFFLIGNSLRPGKIVWLHTLYEILDRLSGRVFHFTHPTVGTLTAANLNAAHKRRIGAELKQQLSPLSYEDKASILKEICRQHGLAFGVELTDDIYMRSEHIRELVRCSCSVGAHSMQHEKLTTLSPLAQEADIRSSKQAIAPYCPDNALTFAYPFGTADSYTEHTQLLLRDCGFQCGLTTLEGTNGPTPNLFELKRIDMRDYSLVELIAHVSGLLGTIKHLTKRLVRRSAAK